MRQRMPVSDPQARETRSGGSAASSPSRDLQVRHDESESDECNTSPPLEGRSAQMKRGASGKAEELAQNMLPSNSSPALDAGAVSVSVPPRDGSVRPRDGRLTGRDADRGRKEDDKMKRREVGKEEEEWRNIPSESEQDKRLHIPKPRNHPNNHDKQNNLSPTIGSRETNRNSDQTNNFKFPNDTDSIREEGRLGTGIHPLLSSGVDPRVVRVIDSISLSAINDGISGENTASQSGSGERGAIGGVETADKSIDNQDSLLRRVGTSVVKGVRGYIPTVCNAVSEHILKP
eukprot:XP_003729751.1 PREDICTED: uncharacterized protein LOC100893128 [Strongylocentrotus purpuratus]